MTAEIADSIAGKLKSLSYEFDHNPDVGYENTTNLPSSSTGYRRMGAGDLPDVPLAIEDDPSPRQEFHVLYNS